MHIQAQIRDAVAIADNIERRVHEENKGADRALILYRVHMATLIYCANIQAEASSKMRSEE